MLPMNYTTLAHEATLNNVIASLQERNFEPIIFADRKTALEKIKSLIPQGASVMNGASVTLEAIGFIDYLKSGKHGWSNLHEAIVTETDPVKQKNLRQQALSSEYYLGSVHALTEQGEMVIVSNSGSQLPHLVFTSPNIILVVSTMKIVRDLTMAFERIEKQVIPLEDVRIQKVYGVHTMQSKTLIFHRENPAMGRKVRVILVREELGF